MYRPRLLQILVEVIEQRAVAAGLELAQVQLAVSADAADVGDPLAVWADARRHRPALNRDRLPLASGVQIAADNRVNRAVQILVVFELLARRDVLAVIQVAAIRR